MSQTRDELHGRDSSGTKKKQYEPPKLTRVSLRPEEAVLGACKTASISGPASPGTPCAYPVPCPNPGS
ncbi:MAG: hypothetical protein WBQ34_07525 [Candidatus Acidiferrales bacterium]